MSRSISAQRKRPWQDVAQEAKEYRDSSMRAVAVDMAKLMEPESLCIQKNVMSMPGNYLTEYDVEITRKAPEDLLAALAVGGLTATSVTMAFLRRSFVAQNLVNCITELLPERAISRAKYLDEFLAQNGRPIGPLHGLPISVKEHIGMKGLRMHAGYVGLWENIAEDDAHILQILWRAGAVFHARTTEPQSMMQLETNSNLYGVTLNPYNRDLTAGGSSGGEGALIGLRGSCLGIGSDVGGSIRSPAANNGIYGLKPTGFRIPTDGWSSIAAGVDSIITVVGPLSTSVKGIKIFMKTILDTKPWLWEPALIPLPWNSALHISPQKPLKIAVMWHDNIVKPHPPIQRALQEVSCKLKTIPNVSIVDWKPYLHDEALAIISSLYFTDGGAEDIELMEKAGEPILPLTKWIIRENPCAKKLTMGNLQYWQEEREAYRKEYAKEWNDTATGRNDETGEMEGVVDVILCPVGPGVAPRHNTAKYWGYTSQWNLLDYPALVFPVSKVDPKIDMAQTGYKPMNETDKDNWKLYEPLAFAGLPISLQLVGRRFEDEKVIAVLEYMTREINLPFVEFP